MITSFIEFRISKTLAISVFFLCFIAAYFDTLAWMMPAWFSPQGFYSHSPLLVLLVGHLLWRERREFLASHRATTHLTLVALFAVSFSWLIAWAANLIIAQIFAAYLVLLSGACLIFGKRSYRIVLPILFLLLFTLPIWQPIQFILQNLATCAVQTTLNIMGITVYVEGNLINIPNGLFEIEGGCSGIGFILVSLGLSGYLSLLDRLSIPQSIKLLLIGGVIALFANWVRILLIVLVGYYGGMDQPLVRDHVGFGWIVYSTIFFPYLFLITKYTQKGKVPNSPFDYEPGRIKMTTFSLILVLGFAFPGAHITWGHLAENRPPIVYTLPKFAGNFEKQASASIWSPVYPTADNTTLSMYTDNNSSTLHVFVANYSNQKQGSEVIHFGNHLYKKSNEVRNHSTLDTGKTEPAVVTELMLEKLDGTVMGIWYWYKIGSDIEPTELHAKIAQVRQKLMGRGDATLVAISANCVEPTCTMARKNFLRLVKYL